MFQLSGSHHQVSKYTVQSAELNVMCHACVTKLQSVVKMVDWPSHLLQLYDKKIYKI
jgi:hypothetical protein